MCGIVGIVAKHPNEEYVTKLKRSVDMLKHRGPNDDGVWAEDNVYLGHVRLSIHDLSAAGHQPMLSHCGRWVIAFNGEIYNYLNLKNALSKDMSMPFQSDTDTEVLVNAIAVWGVETTLKQTTGMFAFACWDRYEKCLYLARDRFGEKPLYYGHVTDDFVFASELKAIQVNYIDALKIDQNALVDYMRLGYVPTPRSIYKGIKKLSQGSYLCVKPSGESKIINYWSAKDEINQTPAYQGSYEQAKNDVERLLKESISLQLSADVPVGAFLSGGVDSSLVVAMMQSMRTSKVNTFSIGFAQKNYDEAQHALAVAKHLGTQHTELYISEKEALDLIPDLAHIYDEPFADSSQIPTYLVSKLAAKSVKVSLTGDGADELFGGYTRHWQAPFIKHKLVDSALYRNILRLTPASLLTYAKQTKWHKIAEQLARLKKLDFKGNDSLFSIYSALRAQNFAYEDLVMGVCVEQKEQSSQSLLEKTSAEQIMYWDSQHYMMDDILTKVDRSAMANSLETRVPFLNHHLFKLAFSLPLSYKINAKRGKVILKDILHQYVPQSLVERPKMGFSIPLAHWLKGELKPLAEYYLFGEKLAQTNMININLTHHFWTKFLAGENSYQNILWNILMFSRWLEKWH
ncbi:asparagine synthase (glutamine-hydrolyzing) [Cysteiniphilum sp. JM-1]|uniref:asparagine synthase (glutamine-hydrolyzing) n=1 Tax=Cysteiniphilum sp. JM-1 TaxID=2610891 RepID=UPI001244F32D|nr:asparagine synthase (glutamine-hydrolyzing) [Cysteiniphilum sp. JM-1]